MIIETRQYRLEPGKRDEWVRVFEDVVVPYQVTRGMDVVGSFVSNSDPDQFFWIRRYEDEAQKAALQEAVYQDPEWESTIRPQLKGLLAEVVAVHEYSPTPGSKL